MKDCLGNSVLLHARSSLQPLNDFVAGFIACEARAVNVLTLAESDPSAIAQAYCAALHMFAESPEGPVQARPFIDAALRAAPGASRREQQFVAAISAWVQGDLAQAIRLHQALAQTDPRDLVSIKLGQYHLFNEGDASGMLRLALTALPAAADVAQMHGMAAFGWEQCHLMEQAESAARTALAMTPREPWAQHALAHVMLTQGRLQEGQQFLQHSSAGWTGLNSFMQTHNWWHLALFEIDLGHADVALQLYDCQVWGVVKAYTQDQIGAVSLLARLELAGVDVGERWQDVADHLLARTADQILPFLDLQYLYGLARAGRPQAESLLCNIEAKGRTHGTPPNARSTDVRQVWRDVATPAARGLMAHAQGDHARAAEWLGMVLPRLVQIGGSHAQRDLFEQIHLDAMMHCGQWSAAQQLVQQRCNQQPQSQRLRHQSRRIYSALGVAIAAG